MALKDWKKTRNYYEGTQFVKHPGSDEKYLIIDKNTGGRYSVIFGKRRTGLRELLQVFKSKSQALKFAKQYMRKH